MFCQDRQRVAIFLSSLLLFIIWSFRLLDVHDAILTVLFDEYSKQQEERAFLREAMNVEFPAPIDYEPIREVCARTQFRPGLLFSCEGQHGGVGMVRNQILRCIRYAINGGGAIVVPSMAMRNASDISDIETTTEVPLDYLLVREAFVKHLSEGCPGMQIYDRAADFPFYQQRVGEPLTLIGDQFEPDHPREGLRHPREWRRFFDEWLDQQSVRIRSNIPVHVEIGQSFLEYPVRDDGKAFAHEFGKILSFRNDTRTLAAKVLLELRQRFALSIDPAKAINPGAFYGAHLRLEEDAIGAWPPEEWRFSRMADQFEEQFQNLERTGLNVVYVASGNRTVVDLFAEYLNKRLAAESNSDRKNVTVVTKHDLLRGADLQQLNSLTFDQQALVDFLMMFKASSFMGVAHSSFPWNVALRRHELSKYREYGNEGSDLLRDEYSIIMGMATDYPWVDPFVYGIWP
ncbi:alternative oxidase [Seiridium cupressi]